jgi:ABC-2 type transport system permease protein
MSVKLMSLWYLTLARLREFLRAPEAVFWTFAFPLLLAGGLAVAFRDKDVEKVFVAVVAPDRAPGDSAASNLAQALVAAANRTNSELNVRMIPADSIADVLRTGTAALVAQAEARGSVTYHFDPVRPEARVARKIVDDVVQRANGRSDAVTVRDVTTRERGSRYIDFFVPGLIAMNIMGSSIFSLVFALVVHREKKLLKLLAATPMSRLYYLLSFVTSRLVFLVLEMVILLGFGVWVMGVPIRGSLTLLALISLVGAASFGAIGLLVSARAKTVEGASGMTNLVMLPMWIVSGVFFASSNFPAAVQPLVKALPLTALVDAMRGVMLQGVGLAAVWPELVLLIGYFVVSLAVALKIFRWQ